MRELGSVSNTNPSVWVSQTVLQEHENFLRVWVQESLAELASRSLSGGPL